MSFRLLLIAVTGAAALCTSAMASAVSRQQVDHFLDGLSSDNSHVTPGSLDWGILPGPFYTPELGAGIGVAAAGFYRTSSDPAIRTSNVTATGFAGSTGAFGLGLDNYTFFADARWRFRFSGDISHRPSWYWGEGYQAAHSERGKQKYSGKSAAIKPVLLQRVASNSYLGLGWNLSWMEVQVKQQHKKSGVFNTRHPALNVLNSGPMVNFIYDSRDDVTTPQRGVLFDLRFSEFTPGTGSDNRFHVWEGEYNHYQPLDEKNVLAWDMHARLASGDVPWTMDSLLGDSKYLRGYYQGRYRDRAIFSGQLEWRHHFSWRHGMVLWAGAGTLSHHSHDLLQHHWLPSVGTGYRFAFKKQANVRLDFGVGKGSSGFYFQVGEAF